MLKMSHIYNSGLTYRPIGAIIDKEHKVNFGYIPSLRSSTTKAYMAKGDSMKWNKFQKLQEKYSFLTHDLCWRGNSNKKIKEFVRTKVGFIAFRLFNNLDLTSKYSLDGRVPVEPHPHLNMEVYSVAEYQISFHVEGEDEGTRLRHVDPGVGDGSIQAHIDDIQQWFDGCEFFDGKQLVWERVVKRATKGSCRGGLIEMNLEIYLFPRFYRFKPMPAPQQADPARRAYFEEGEMPPIIPSLTGINQ